MNINNFEAPEGVPKNYTEAIFARQTELMNKYHHIEMENNLCPPGLTFPYDLDDRFAQYRIKDFCWRTTEELMEAWEAYKNEDEEHYLEELIDALHFITELCINVGLQPDMIHPLCYNSYPGLWGMDFDNPEDIVAFNIPNMIYAKFQVPADDILLPVYWLGMAANCLKNKPWKQSHVSTDKAKFMECLATAYTSLIDLLGNSGLSSQEIYEIYYKKSEVNKFRQRSNY